MTRRLVMIAAVLLCLGAGARVVRAESVRVVSYPMDLVWPAALRLLRVDLKYAIVERDREGGFIVFELVDDGKTWRTAMQLTPAVDNKGRTSTRVAVKIEGRPSYVSDTLLERFGTKLKAELGDPVAPPAPAPAPAPAPTPAPNQPGGTDGDKPAARPAK